MDKKEMLRYLEERAADFYALSDKIWENAEVQFKEEQSCRDTAEFLKNEGFSVRTDVAGMPTALIAEWGSGKPVIGFLGEYDALTGLSQKAGVAERSPENEGAPGHGCGHNLLGVGSLIGAVGYKHYLEKEGKPGKVMFFGCPAEEGGGGKTFMARASCFHALDCAFCWHPATMNLVAPGPLLANCEARFSFIGTASHAASSPEKGRSALDALELMNTGIQYLREHIPSTARVHYAITDAGGSMPNIVQDHAAGLYLLRAPEVAIVADIYDRVRAIAYGATMMTGTDVDIQFLKGTSNTVLIPALDEVMDRNLRSIPNPVKEASDLDFANEIIKTQPGNHRPDMPVDTTILPYNRAGNIPLPGSSDTGDVSWVCPLSQCGVATWPAGTAPHSWQAVACGKSDFAHRGMLFAGMVIAASAMDVYEDPQIIQEAKKQFREKTGNLPYRCPIPEDITPAFLAKELLDEQ